MHLPIVNWLAGKYLRSSRANNVKEADIDPVPITFYNLVMLPAPSGTSSLKFFDDI